jgi:hypothetical protein
VLGELSCIGVLGELSCIGVLGELSCVGVLGELSCIDITPVNNFPLGDRTPERFTNIY